MTVALLNDFFKLNHKNQKLVKRTTLPKKFNYDNFRLTFKKIKNCIIILGLPLISTCLCYLLQFFLIIDQYPKHFDIRNK